MPARISLVGQTFGRLKVIEDVPTKTGRSKSLCLCDCGNELITETTRLKFGGVHSCGCLQREGTGLASRIHGMSRTGIYGIWKAMVKRCCNPNSKRFSDYGGRGITVCERWMHFPNFYQDMGDGKLGWGLERIDNDSGYSLDNICWATAIPQGRNKRNNKIVTVRGVTGCLSEVCERFGVKYKRVVERLLRGWTAERAFFESAH